MSSSETISLVVGIAATLQLIRLSIDLIATASQRDAAATEKLESASRDELRRSIVASGRTSLPSRFFSSFRSKSTIRTLATEATRTNDQERQDDVLPQLNGTNHSKTSSLKNDENNDDEKDEETMRHELSGIEKQIVRISAIATGCLFVYFLVCCVLQSLDKIDAVYDAFPLGCSAAFFFLAGLVAIRDYQRRRFTNTSRIFHSCAALLLALGVIFCVALTDEDLHSVDIASLVLFVVYAILVIIECKMIDLPYEMYKDKKARLSMKSILMVLRPYFWPDATATSATLNRIRAMATWVFVIGSKACGLLAPIYLGRASTALTLMNYSECIANIVWYSLLTFGTAVLKEAQSLVYLRVAQAAFVQLAELAFSHLHSLSLDWHLRKKLGEVIRSMDRGILACDTLIKYLFLWLIPSIAECILVTVIFATYFDYLPLAVAVFYFVFAYVVLTVLLTLWRKKFRKQVAKSDNDWHDIATDSLVNFETVKYFTAEEFEMKKFGSAVETFQKGSVNVAASLSMLNILQRFLLQACLATSLSLTALSIKDRMDCCIANGCSDGISECCSNLSNLCSGMEIGDFGKFGF
jgi:ABC-type multidrug transport system fused ATPase/permease subunit